MYFDNAAESRLARAVTTFFSVLTKSFSLDVCPKQSVAENIVMIMAEECFNIIAAYGVGLADVPAFLFRQFGKLDKDYKKTNDG